MWRALMRYVFYMILIMMISSCKSPNREKLVGEWQGFSGNGELRENISYIFHLDGTGEWSEGKMKWKIRDFSLNEKRDPPVLTLKLEDPFGDRKNQKRLVEFVTETEIIFTDAEAGEITLYMDKGRLVRARLEKLRNTNKNAMIADCALIAALSQRFYRTPESLGGGGYSFKGFKILANLRETANGEYNTAVVGDTLSIVGIGKKFGMEEVMPLKMTLTVLPRSLDVNLQVRDELANDQRQEFSVKILSLQNFLLFDEQGHQVALEIGAWERERAQNEAFKDANRGALLHQCATIATRSQNYYRKPKTLAGGALSFKGFKIRAGLRESHNGKFSTTAVTDSTLVIVGIGKEIGDDNENPVKISMTVTPSAIATQIVN